MPKSKRNQVEGIPDTMGDALGQVVGEATPIVGYGGSGSTAHCRESAASPQASDLARACPTA
jgi:hypothetical protein